MYRDPVVRAEHHRILVEGISAPVHTSMPVSYARIPRDSDTFRPVAGNSFPTLAAPEFPEEERPSSGPAWIIALCGVLIVLIIGSGAFMNAKRSTALANASADATPSPVAAVETTPTPVATAAPVVAATAAPVALPVAAPVLVPAAAPGAAAATPDANEAPATTRKTKKTRRPPAPAAAPRVTAPVRAASVASTPSPAPAAAPAVAPSGNGGANANANANANAKKSSATETLLKALAEPTLN